MEEDLGLDALVERSRQQFVAAFPADFERLTALADAAAAGDGGALAELRLGAHRLVGRAGILQFTVLARHAAALETVARVDEARHFDSGASAACLGAMRDAFGDLRPAAAPVVTPSAAARPLILVADDDADQRFLLTRLLQRAGFDVEALATGAALIERARVRCPSAILLDVQMPGQDGYTTGRLLRDDPRTAAVPVMFLSGLTAPGPGAPAAGGADHAQKSIDPVELLDRVRALCARITPSSG